MSKAPTSSGYVDAHELFRMTLGEFAAMWGLTADEVKRELMAARIAAWGKQEGAGYVDLHFYYPAVRGWVARKREMPARVQAKVETAGGLKRLDQWFGDQFRLCKFDLVDGTITLPDGRVLTNVTIRQASQH